ncbi:MAG: hypothetical protein DRQ49_07050 [Gammaproteobacteria bacterium]|nr:MAG: hypothetical protein DRQ49_07050 [Gammaproteobacteria bacterium]RKZ45350.1 MAG: hypothetical protein DRQ41_00485 [Gammaproteobacteria bacterium]RKZ71905.1 MAG: hypothetical protein DRQ57_18070 [Gammaproteobacteria bacterium]
MITPYFMVEGAFDQFILERILPEKMVSQTKIITGNGYNIALSKARSLLISSELPVSLIVDSDTTDRSSIEEKKDFMTQSLQQLSTPDHFHVFFAVPEIEVIFFSSREIIEELIGGKVSEQQWELAHYQPKQALLNMLHTNNLQKSFHELLTPSLIEKLGKTDFVQNIIKNCQVAA